MLGQGATAGRGSNSGHTLFPRKRCSECGATTFRQNCPQLLGKTTHKSEANVGRVGVGILRNDSALTEQSPVASACEQSGNYGIASLFDCVMPCVSGCYLEEPKVQPVILQNNNVPINDEASVSFVTAECHL